MRNYASERRPNLFIIGAMKSGTSSLHSYLSTHPSIFMCEPKEPSYFVDAAQLKLYWPSMWDKRFWKDESTYLKLFEKADTSKIIGESSTTYTKLPQLTGVAQRIKAFNADAKFVYIMRDPVERTISHYWHMVRWEGERRTPLEAIMDDPHYCDVSNYAMQLEPYLKHFEAERIFTLTLEELASDPIGMIQQIFRWLNIDSGFVPSNLAQTEHATPPQMRQVKGKGLFHKFRHSHLWSIVGPRVPKRIRSLARNLSDTEINRKLVCMDDVIDFLRPRQLCETEQLVHLLGREFSEWKTLHNNR